MGKVVKSLYAKVSLESNSQVLFQFFNWLLETEGPPLLFSSSFFFENFETICDHSFLMFRLFGLRRETYDVMTLRVVWIGI